MGSVQTPFERDGYLGPVPVLAPGECRAVKQHLEQGRHPPADWPKGRAVTDPFWFRLATNARLLPLITSVLGDDVVLWGCSVARRRPGAVHPWHVDVESASGEGRFVTLWIGVENASGASGLRLIAGSHRAGKTVQQVQSERGYARGEAATETVLGWAREQDPEARLVEPEVADGEALLLDGRIWHGSHNRLEARTRTALLLQFASADSPVRMPDPKCWSWPFRFLDHPRPPVILVHGMARDGANRLVAPPSATVPASIASLCSCIGAITLPLAENPDGWRRYPLFRGSTANIDMMSAHVSVLSAGHSPHEPHAHGDEELLIVLDGAAELLITEDSSLECARTERVGPGDFVYYPAQQHHTIRNPGAAPVTYLMFRWHTASAVEPAPDALGVTIVRKREGDQATGPGFATRLQFEQPTRWLSRLHCHRTRLAPGCGYAAHVDAHDVAILVQSGRVETLGREVGPNGVIYYPAGQSHGMRNVGDEPAHYLVFEFHSFCTEPPREGVQVTPSSTTLPPLAPQACPRVAPFAPSR